MKKSTDVIFFVAVVAGAAILRLVNLGHPARFIFDESYYAPDACWYVIADEEMCSVATERTWVHPPLGKWLIAVGIRGFGYEPFGWRISAAVAGTITVALLFLLARKLLNSNLASSVAAGLFSIEFMHVIHSRIAMLDVFVAMFGVAAMLFLVCDRDSMLAYNEFRGSVRRKWLVTRPWRWASGLMCGAAVATKWPGALILAAAVLLTTSWAIKLEADKGGPHPIRRAMSGSLPSLVVSFALIPAAIYILTFVGRIEGDLMALPWSDASWFGQLWDRHLQMLRFHIGVEATTAFQSPPWSWFLLKRPLSELVQSNDGGYVHILMTGNPLVWWSIPPALLVVAFKWLKTRSVARPEGIIVAGFVLTYGFWLAPWGRPATYMFYVLPSLPFAYLALGYLARRIESVWEGRMAIATFAMATIALTMFYSPVLFGRELSHQAWRHRIWIFHDCDQPGTASPPAVAAGTDTPLPPEGWCWY